MESYFGFHDYYDCVDFGLLGSCVHSNLVCFYGVKLKVFCSFKIVIGLFCYFVLKGTVTVLVDSFSIFLDLEMLELRVKAKTLSVIALLRQGRTTKCDLQILICCI